MSQPRNLVIQSEPLDGAILSLVHSPGRCDPEGQLQVDRLGVRLGASFTAKGGKVFVAYLDGEPAALGALSPTPDGRANLAAMIVMPHRSALSIKRAMLDHLEDAAHLEGYHRAIPSGRASWITGVITLPPVLAHAL